MTHRHEFVSFAVTIFSLSVQGRVNNWSHPALQELCESFYYGDNRIGTRFPADFKDGVPRVALVFAATAVCVI